MPPSRHTVIEDAIKRFDILNTEEFIIISHSAKAVLETMGKQCLVMQHGFAVIIKTQRQA